MKNIKQKLLSVLFAGVALTSIQVSAQETIKFATEPTYPPFEFVDGNNQMQGFDIDIARALCTEIKAQCSFHNQGFDSIIPTLKMGKYDAAISAMDITQARLKQVNFSTPYYDNSAAFVVTKDSTVDSIEQLKGLHVGVQNGTTHQQYIINEMPDIHTTPYSSYQDAFLDLKNNRIQAVFGDTAVINEFISKDDTVKSMGQSITNVKYFGHGLGIAVAKNKTELLDQLNKALLAIKANGTYQKIYTKYFEK